MRIRIATRGSALARAQAMDVARRLAQLGHMPELGLVATAGDVNAERTFTDIGAFGIFVRELESALLDGRADVAVHSYKDLPSRSPESLVIAAVPERLDAADVLLVRAEAADVTAPVFPVRAHARVGTSAARRQALLAAARPDLAMGLLRGNVPTRVRALLDDRFDAIVLAAAGLQRLGTTPERSGALDELVPAAGQGILALEARAGDERVREACATLADAETAEALRAERALVAALGADCHTPVGAHASGGVLRAFVGRPDGSAWVRDEQASQPGEDAEGLGRRVGERLLSAGARELLDG